MDQSVVDLILTPHHRVEAPDQVGGQGLPVAHTHTIPPVTAAPEHLRVHAPPRPTGSFRVSEPSPPAEGALTSVLRSHSRSDMQPNDGMPIRPRGPTTITRAQRRTRT
jgi:hypothetical protein